MSDRIAINEAISTWFEPKPSHLGDPPDKSEKGFWYTAENISWNWKPAYDYFTEESANARLLDAMPFITLSHFNGTDEDSSPFWECRYSSNEPGPYVDAPDRKTAVVLAFCKFAGIEVPND